MAFKLIESAQTRRQTRSRQTRKGQVQRMIARIWRGWASTTTADDYQHHYESEVAEHLQQVAGFRGARLLRRQDGEEVMFTSITFFTGMDDVRAFAGKDPEQAVVEETARRALTRWDERDAIREGPSAVHRDRQAIPVGHLG
ncbi:hypothetical protein AB0F17_23115 [Nonomuraea sp. NPDC026600]|uniref:hypothetical protein n=1 Tax=Nonomuraea sp. NPDC026600 TaxID=3155363 RepID=UPI0033D6EE30